MAEDVENIEKACTLSIFRLFQNELFGSGLCQRVQYLQRWVWGLATECPTEDSGAWAWMPGFFHWQTHASRNSNTPGTHKKDTKKAGEP